MTLPTPPVTFVDYGSVADAATSSNDWGSVAVLPSRFEDWEEGTVSSVITSTNQVTKPVDKMWAFLGEMERRKDEEIN